MRTRQILRSIEGHIAESKELMRQNREAFDRNTKAFERNTEAFEQNRVAHDDMREFIREMTLRIEKGAQHQVSALGEIKNSLVGLQQEIKADRKELRADSEAHRKALLALIDRLPPPHAEAA